MFDDVTDPFRCVIPSELWNDQRVYQVLLSVLAESSLPGLPVQVMNKPGSSIGPEDEGRVLVPVVAASRAHSDITAALGKAKLSESYWGLGRVR